MIFNSKQNKSFFRKLVQYLKNERNIKNSQCEEHKLEKLAWQTIDHF